MHKDAADFEKFEFCLFAMGDSAYTKFNWIGLQIARRLEHLKGSLLFPVVSCDERHQLGYDFGADKGIAELQELLIKNNIGMFDYAVPYFPRCPVEKIGDGEFHFIDGDTFKI
jgi:sulfite reductase alpha subunit-like flavoprotein